MGRIEDHTSDNSDPRDQSRLTPGGSEVDNSWLEMGPEGREAWRQEGTANLVQTRADLAARQGSLAVGDTVDASEQSDESAETERDESAVVADAVTRINAAFGIPEEASKPEREPTVAFGGYVKEEQHNPDGKHDLDSVTQEMRDKLSITFITDIVLNNRGAQTRPGGETFAAQIVPGRNSSSQVALPPAEYALIPRYPKALARQAQARTLNGGTPDAEKLGAANRSGSHALEAKLEKMAPHLEELKTRREDIRKLRKIVATPGQKRTRVSEMARLTQEALDEFGVMLNVVHVARKWTDQERECAEATLLHLLTRGKQYERVQHWEEMLDLANIYLQRRISIFEQRTAESKARIKIGLADGSNPDADNK